MISPSSLLQTTSSTLSRLLSTRNPEGLRRRRKNGPVRESSGRKKTRQEAMYLEGCGLGAVTLISWQSNHSGYVSLSILCSSCGLSTAQWIICLFPFLSGPYSIRPLFLDETYDSLASIKTALLGLHPLFPAMALSCLFIGSTLFTESISLKKYPVTYEAYQKRVSMFLPWDTAIKGFLLALSKEKAEIDRLVWGNPETIPSGKGKGKVE